MSNPFKVGGITSLMGGNSSKSIAVTTATGAGDSLCLLAETNGTAQYGDSVSDSQGNVWVRKRRYYTTGPSFAMFCAEGPTGGSGGGETAALSTSDTVTVTLNASSTLRLNAVIVAVPSSGALDQLAAVTHYTSVTSAPVSVTPGYDDETVVAMASVGAGPSTDPAFGSPATDIPCIGNTGGPWVDAGWRVLSGGGGSSVTLTSSWTGNSNPTIAAMSFRSGAVTYSGDASRAGTAGVNAGGAVTGGRDAPVPVTVGVSPGGVITAGVGAGPVGVSAGVSADGVAAKTATASAPLSAGVSADGVLTASADASPVAISTGVSPGGMGIYPAAALVAATAGAATNGAAVRPGAAVVAASAAVTAVSAGGATLNGAVSVGVTAGVSAAGSVSPGISTAVIYAGTSGAGSSTHTVTASTQAGDAIAVWVNTDTSASGVSDSQGNTYVLVSNDTTHAIGLWVAAYKGSAGTATAALASGTDTISAAGSFTGGGILAVRVRGVGPAGADSAPAYVSQTTRTPSGPATGTLSQSGDAVLGSYAGAGTMSVSSWGGSFSQVGSYTGGGGATYAALVVAPSTSSVTPSATLAASVRTTGLTVALPPQAASQAVSGDLGVTATAGVSCAGTAISGGQTVSGDVTVGATAGVSAAGATGSSDLYQNTYTNVY